MRPTHAPSPHAPSLAQQDAPLFAVSLNAVIVAATPDEPRILVLRTEQGRLAALPAGPLTPHHPTLEAGLRAWVGQQTDQHLGYVEQLYTFGDRSRTKLDGAAAPQGLAIAYLALVREARPAGSMQAGWQNWYRYFPWEDWREGRPGILEPIRQKLLAWAALAPTIVGRRSRGEWIELTFGFADLGWSDERVLERYELLYEAGLVEETGESTTETGGRPARLVRFRREVL